jgi:hypothetical protein
VLVSALLVFKKDEDELLVPDVSAVVEVELVTEEGPPVYVVPQ